jgi:transcriptional antiterminator RfaH
MPILPAETSLFPDDLLSSPPNNTEGKLWWVLHSRPRAEKCLARQFLSKRVAFYLPLHARRWVSRGKTLRSHMPLFPGYVFLHGDAEDRRAALATNLVVSVFPVPNQEQLHADLRRVQRALAAGSSPAPEEALQPGAVVKIVEGPLAGLEGKIIRRKNDLRFLVEVQFLRRGVSVEIEETMIRGLEGAAVACG